MTIAGTILPVALGPVLAVLSQNPEANSEGKNENSNPDYGLIKYKTTISSIASGKLMVPLPGRTAVWDWDFQL
jgi:hypothetical protein